LGVAILALADVADIFQNLGVAEEEEKICIQNAEER
jgi:hypothetical protein